MAGIVMRTPQYTVEERVFLLEQKIGKNPHKVIKDNYKKNIFFLW